MQVSIDRIEGMIAVLTGSDDESIRITVPASCLPPGSREGDILNLALTQDKDATLAAQERVAALQEKLKKRLG